MKLLTHYRKTLPLLVVVLLLSVVMAACGGDAKPAGGATKPAGGETAQPTGESTPTGGESTPAADADKELTKVRMQIKWVPQSQFAGYFVALDKGYYKDEGLDVQIIPGGPDLVPEQQVANGAADIGTSWVTTLYTHREEGYPLIELAQIFQKSGLALISKQSSGINTPADFKGKKVGSWFGGREYEILALFEKYGLDSAKDVSFTKQGFTQDQFLTGDLDVASTMTYNELPLLLKEGAAGPLNVFDMNAEGVAMLQDNIFVSEDWLKDNKETAVKFVRASLKGWQDAVNDPEETADIIMKYADSSSTTREHQLTMMQEVAKLVVPEGSTHPIGYIDEELMQQTADIALQFGVINKEADVAKSYTTEILEQAWK